MWEMLWALVGRTNLLSVATKLDVPVFHAKRVELGCTRHVRVNSSVSKGFSSLFLFQAVQNYECSRGVSGNNAARCLARKLVLVIHNRYLWQWRGTVKVTEAAMWSAHALTQMPSDQTRVWAFCFLVGLPLEKEASCKRCAHALPLSSLVPATGCLLVTSQRRLLRSWENKSAQSLLHHPSPSLSTLTGYFQ